MAQRDCASASSLAWHEAERAPRDSTTAGRTAIREDASSSDVDVTANEILDAALLNLAGASAKSATRQKQNKRNF